jgi:hypothetical protein
MELMYAESWVCPRRSFSPRPTAVAPGVWDAVGRGGTGMEEEPQPIETATSNGSAQRALWPNGSLAPKLTRDDLCKNYHEGAHHAERYRT